MTVTPVAIADTAVVTPQPRPKRTRTWTGKAIAGQILLYAVLVVLALIYIYPFLVQVSTSFKTDAEATADPISLIPQRLVDGGVRAALHCAATSRSGSRTRPSSRSASRSAACSSCRSPATRSRGCTSAGAASIFAAVVAVMAVPGVVLLIPRFLVINQLGIYDSYAGMILPLLVDAAGVFIMKNFFESIPVSVEEQARIDGAGTFRIFWSVVLPMARPALITIIILSFQGSWNELPPLHRVDAVARADDADEGCGIARVRPARARAPSIPLKLAAATHHDDPGRRDVLHLPEADHEHERGGGEGVTDTAAEAQPLQPLLSDAVIALRAPTQVWSAASGDLGAAAIHGVYHGDIRHVREADAHVRRRGCRSGSRSSADGPSRVVFGGLLRALDDPSPDPKVRLLRERVVADGAVGETLTIVSHVGACRSRRPCACASCRSSPRCRR